MKNDTFNQIINANLASILSVCNWTMSITHMARRRFAFFRT